VSGARQQGRDKGQIAVFPCTIHRFTAARLYRATQEQSVDQLGTATRGGCVATTPAWSTPGRRCAWEVQNDLPFVTAEEAMTDSYA
jgi:hypothetical protein